ncbi:8-oxo-dGTP pyrophosphatase MutT (NUDIX family) [Kitasatospora sp. GP30]|jgi:8-oxo-dGTP pyrophosphatase MutT (NUDIX family)|uniref:NUDIX domain-containing protein n=1 Tax=Kitasatospora sp. GP30 TaxID=3035084 RepID=UPI000C70947B|nr:NUDIX hydrolase [Kitasatospora sp. GP30]MDH6142793.1 8-oxo-dGTP pyrophosphatase MutT (NUDIX family) [Kitasatospora sp. GP30]
MAKIWMPREEFVNTLPRALHSSSVLLFDPEGRLLLLHDSYSEGRAARGWPQRWWAPGGILQDGEAPVDGARLETLEETGLRLDGELFPVGVDFLSPAEGWPPVSSYFFSTGPLTWEQVESITLSEEHDDHQFHQLADWEGKVSATMQARLTALVTAFAYESQIVLHCGRPM